MYKKIILLTLASSLLYSCSTKKQITSKPATPNIQTYVNSITAEDLKTYVYTIASDQMQGRNTGEEGQKKAGRYIIEQHQKNGLSFPKGATSYYQSIPSAYFKKSFSPKLGDSENIWVYIQGTEKPEELVVVSAHYDHVGMKNSEIYNGADDNASGTSGLIEIAQAFALAQKDGFSPKRSILFLHLTGEEHGLFGSKYYTENPLFPLANTVADINIDMIGRRDDLHKDTNNYVYVIGSDYLSTDLYNITENANKTYTHLQLDYKYNDKNDPNQFYYRSDHYNFAKHNIPSVFLFNGVHDDYHKPTDKANKIEYDALAKRSQLAFAIAWELANRNKRPIVDKTDKQ